MFSLVAPRAPLSMHVANRAVTDRVVFHYFSPYSIYLVFHLQKLLCCILRVFLAAAQWPATSNNNNNNSEFSVRKARRDPVRRGKARRGASVMAQKVK